MDTNPLVRDKVLDAGLDLWVGSGGLDGRARVPGRENRGLDGAPWGLDSAFGSLDGIA